MNYYEKIIQEKRNTKEEKDNDSLREWSKKCEPLLEKGLSDLEVVAELRKKGLDAFDAKKVLFWTKEHRSSKEKKDNDKEITQDGYRIIVKRAGNGYALRVLDKRGHIVYERDYSPSESMALELGKREARKDFMRKEWDELHSNEKEKKSYYQSIIEKKNESMREYSDKINNLKPIVQAFARKGMAAHEIVLRLEKEKDITPEMARKAVRLFY